MVTRDQFRQIVRKMQDEGVPLSMANLMVRTELPRATIEEWLDDVQRGASFAKPERPAAEKADRDGKAGEKSRGERGGLKGMAKSLKAEVVGDLVKSQLGLSEKGTKDPDTKRELKVGGVLGLVLPPVGLVYSAPWTVAAAGTALYAALVWLALLFPMIGIPYVLIPMHLVGGLAGAAYAWRYNRAGKRTPLLPKGAAKDD